jgi:hypothetical protein
MSTDNVHLVRTAKTEIDESVMGVLDELMKEAKEGRLAAIAVAVIRPDGCMNSTFSNSDKAAMLLGAVQLLSSRLLASLE